MQAVSHCKHLPYKTAGVVIVQYSMSKIIEHISTESGSRFEPFIYSNYKVFLYSKFAFLFKIKYCKDANVIRIKPKVFGAFVVTKNWSEFFSYNWQI
jgi:hypothetical protein